MGVSLEFDVGGAGYEGFDVEGREGDEVGFGDGGGIWGGKGEEGVADLFNVDGAGEGGFLGVVALELERGYVRGGRLMVEVLFVWGGGLPEYHVWRLLCNMQLQVGDG